MRIVFDLGSKVQRPAVLIVTRGNPSPPPQGSLLPPRGLLGGANQHPKSVQAPPGSAVLQPSLCTSQTLAIPKSQPSLPFPASLTLSCGCPCSPQGKNAALQKKSKAGTKQGKKIGKKKKKESSLVLFSFLGHFELIKECDLNYKYPPSRMIYGLFVLDWYVLNL